MKKVEIYYSDSWKKNAALLLEENWFVPFNPGYYWELHVPEWELEEIQGRMKAYFPAYTHHTNNGRVGNAYRKYTNRYRSSIKRVNGPFKTEKQAMNDIFYKFDAICLERPNIV